MVLGDDDSLFLKTIIKANSYDLDKLFDSMSQN